MQNLYNETEVEKAFSNQSVLFDNSYDSNYLINYSRKIIRNKVIKLLNAGDEILELNAGTGTDASFFASKGFHVTATDVSPKMVELANAKFRLNNLEKQAHATVCNFWNIDAMDSKQYDFVYSNFGGLNCTDRLDIILDKILSKLKPGGRAFLVIMPVFCPWERIMLLRGNTVVGLRRRANKPALAHIEGVHFKVWYYHPNYIIRALRGKARVTSYQSLRLLVPPSSHENFDKKYPRLLKFLEKIDSMLTPTWPFKNWGDYVMVAIQK
jgi:ubiquinone/menaquinone biosynthesis C-methylase UbiE